MADNPRHGENIIDRTMDAFGRDKFIATKQFQRFLDELGSLVNDQTGDEEQDIFSISVQIGKNTASIRANSSDIEDVLSYLAAIESENSQLRAKINTFVDSFSDLEQVVYGK